MSDEVRGGSSLAAFHSRDFTLFWFSALISNSAQWMQSVSVPIIIFDMTDSNAWVGSVAFTLLIPAFLLTPYAGVLADRVPRIKVLRYTIAVQFLTAMSFMMMWQLGYLTPVWILGLSLIQGVCAGLQIPNWQALVPQLVPQEHLFSAIRWNSVQFTASRAFGPLAGSLILSTRGAGAVFLTNALTYLVLMLALLTMYPRLNPASTTQKAMAAFKEAVRYVLDRPAISQAVLSAFAISFLGQSIVQLAAGLGSERYSVGENGVAGFVTASGIGTIIGSGLIIAYADRYLRSRVVMVGLAFYAFGPVLVGISTIYIVGLAGFFVSGIAHMAVGISLNTSVQAQIPEYVRGRIISVYLMGVFGGLPLGALVGGRLGDLFGLEKVFLGYGAGLVLYLVLVILVFSRHRLLDSDTDTI